MSQTLLFEVRDVRELASRLLASFPEDCRRWTQLAVAEPKVVSVAPPAPKPERVEARRILPASGSRSPSSASAAITRTPGTSTPFGTYCDRAGTASPRFRQTAGRSTDSTSRIRTRRVARGKSYGKWGSFLEGFDAFDPLFFNISPTQALGMDPQERLFLQTAWEAVESAGYTRQRFARTVGGRVGVFVGVTKTGFDKLAPAWRRRASPQIPRTSFGSIANRVSYVLDLHGPSLPIDTMCSSSLTAIHAACQALRLGECDMAIAGGVNLYLHRLPMSNLRRNACFRRTGAARVSARPETASFPAKAWALSS